MEKLLEILSELEAHKAEVESKDIEAVVEAKLAAHRQKLMEEALQEQKAELAVWDIRIDTAKKIYEALSAHEETTVVDETF